VRPEQSAQNISKPLGHHDDLKGEEILACEEAGIAPLRAWKHLDEIAHHEV
jgi:hypothetical protein